MNWICSDSNDPGQCYTGHRLAQAGTEIERTREIFAAYPHPKKPTHLLSVLVFEEDIKRQLFYAVLEMFILPSLEHG